MSSPVSSSDSIPRFAVVGRVNKGKSSILATLVEEADNERIRISNVPGETTRCQSIPLVLNRETLIEFLDTPGFNRARPALDWMIKRAAKRPDAPKIETVREFVEAHRGKREFLDECLLLEPILAGAGVLYVIDASKPFRPDFTAEMEILRWTGRPRMALVNLITEGSDFRAEWRQHLGEYFNLTREFNAHQARFAERIRLLTSLAEIDEARHPNIEKTIRILNREWGQRRGKAADVIIQLVEASLGYRATKTIPREEAGRDSRKAEIARELQSVYLRRIQEIEASHHRQVVALYRHQAHETVEDDSLTRLATDLFAEETWEAFGLNKNQLAVAGAVAGAASGAAVDLATGGHSVGMGTVLGMLAGAAGAFLRGKDLADIKVNIPGSGPLSGAQVNAGGIAIKAGPPRNPNFPWVLLDRALFQFEQIVSRAHGRRDAFVVDFAKLAAEGQRIGRSSRLRGEDRRILQKWFLGLTEGRAQPETGPAYEIINRVLEEIEQASHGTPV
jgi:hypothetical protein